MIIDIHCHTYPDAIAHRALQTMQEGTGLPTYTTDCTVAGLTRSLERFGLDRAISLGVATKPAQVAVINDLAATLTGPVYGFGTLYPTDPAAPEEVARIKALGIPGIKLHPEYQSFYPDDPAVFPVYEAIADSGLPVLFHAGLDICAQHLAHGAPSRLRRVVKNFPRMKIIVAHLGGWRMWDEAEETLWGENVYFDSSSCLELPIERVRAMVRRHGPERILFGSDSPWNSPRDSIEFVERMGLADDQTEGILGLNAARLLGWA